MGYERPAVPVQVYEDEDGVPIEYGSRWRDGGPPEEAYSRTSNLARFAALHTVAYALIGWLRSSFDVEVTAAADVAADLLLQPRDAVYSVRLTPRSPECAPLTFVLTSFPGVYLHAGTLHDFHFPVCGCDACDDDVRSLADELEWTVVMVVTGRYSEFADLAGGGWLEYRLGEPGLNAGSGRVRTDDLPAGRLDAARAVIPADGRWRSWPPLRAAHERSIANR